jgi:hypothetical protein
VKDLRELKPSDLIDFILMQNPDQRLDIMKTGCVVELGKQEEIFEKYKNPTLKDIGLYFYLGVGLMIVIGYLFGVNFSNLYFYYLNLENVNWNWYVSQLGLIFILFFKYSLEKVIQFKIDILITCEEYIKHLKEILNNNTDKEFVKEYVDFDNSWQRVYLNGLMLPISDMLYEIWFRFHWVKVIWLKIRLKIS